MRSSIQLLRSLRARGACFVAFCLCVVVMAGCGENMRANARIEAFEPGEFYRDEQSARPVEAGTVARGLLREDEQFYAGQSDGQPVDTFPYPITREILARGQERYDIFCAPCHGLVGDGQGMIVQRGFSAPPSFHTQRLRDAPVGHYFDVITNGYGRMYSYASRVRPDDRWAIIAYIRALQLSQNATLEDVPPEERQQLQETGQ